MTHGRKGRDNIRRLPVAVTCGVAQYGLDTKGAFHGFVSARVIFLGSAPISGHEFDRRLGQPFEGSQ
jgi:hypothetical protein